MRHVFAGLLLGLAVVAGSAATSSASSTVTATFMINGRSVTTSSSSNPITLNPTQPAQVGITVTNNGSSPITVSSVALSGRTFDITFFDFETETGLQVQPGTTQSQQYTLNFAPLNGQGDGLIPSSIRILDANRKVLASQNFTADVRGRVTSLFGLFGIEVTVFTIILLAGAFLALARGRLHENRFRRGLRFLWPGIGVGVVIVFGGSVLRIFVPSPGAWLSIVLICAAIGFGLGYLTPNPANDELGPPLDLEQPEVTRPVKSVADPHVTLTPSGYPASSPPTDGG